MDCFHNARTVWPVTITSPAHGVAGVCMRAYANKHLYFSDTSIICESSEFNQMC